MDIEILDSGKEFNANFAIVKTSGGIFTIYRKQIHYRIESDFERFSVIPCRLSKNIVDIYWPVGKNPMNISKSLRDDLSKIKDLTGVDPFELMEIVKKEEE